MRFSGYTKLQYKRAKKELIGMSHQDRAKYKQQLKTIKE